MDTIFALASGRGKAGVAVIRISGPGAWAAVAGLGVGVLPPPRRAALRALRDGAGAVLDRALVILFPRGESFTGEAVAELHLHGSPAVVAAVSAALAGMAGLRPAEPGEFTRRALENGRLDLAQVEGLADLIDAETEAQRLQAQRLFDGALGARVAAWRGGLVRAGALIAAGVDFADEDIPADALAGAADELRAVLDGLRAERAGARAAERLRDGFEVAIVGAPNVGKSTLLNYLAGREAALTSEHAGTTRDVIEVRMDLGGLPVTLLDMAGLREAADPVEALGVAAAGRRAAAADLRVFLLAGDGAGPGPLFRDGDILLRGKADLRAGTGAAGAPRAPGPGDALAVSGLTGAGVPALLRRIEAALADRAARPGVFSRLRHRIAAETAETALEAAIGRLAEPDPALELVAEDLRRAARVLESLTGKVDVEDVLDEIFARFCIGK
jgi:tRNA modification GTPase